MYRRHVWKRYCLALGNQRLLEDNKLLIAYYGVKDGEILTLVRYESKTRQDPQEP